MWLYKPWVLISSFSGVCERNRVFALVLILQYDIGGRVSRKQGGWISIEITLKGRWLLLFTLAINTLVGDQFGNSRLLLCRVNWFVAFHQNSHGSLQRYSGHRVEGNALGLLLVTSDLAMPNYPSVRFKSYSCFKAEPFEYNLWLICVNHSSEKSLSRCNYSHLCSLLSAKK